MRARVGAVVGAIGAVVGTIQEAVVGTIGVQWGREDTMGRYGLNMEPW
jgi:hypothetical protein